MATPTLEREGARIGGVTQTTCAMTVRTDSNGTCCGINLYTDKSRTNLAPGITYTDGVLAAGNNYQATAYASGLQPNTLYYWEAIASDDVGNDPRSGNQVSGSEPLTANSFKTISSYPIKWRAAVSGCYNGYQQTLNGTRGKNIHRSIRNILSLDLDAFFSIGDTYYADVGVTTGGYADYTAQHWYAQSSGTDDGTVGHFRTNFITTIDGNQHNSYSSAPEPFIHSLMHLISAVPTYYMWDDHDLCFDDCDDLDESEGAHFGTGDATKLTNGQQVAHECFMNLNKPVCEQLLADGSTRRNLADDADYAFATHATAVVPNGEEFYVVDKPPVRFIVTDNRSFRDSNSTTDSSTHSILGSGQKQWVKDRIDDNPCRFLVLILPMMGDGDHGWFQTNSDNFKNYTHERDEIHDYIRSNGNPTRTVIISADTHNGCVIRYDEFGGKQPLYEFMGSNMWNPSSHGWITGICETNFRSGETCGKTGGTGTGGKLLHMSVLERCITVVDADPDCMRISLVHVDPGENGGGSARENRPETVFTREFV